jgi:membrane protease YdiL (CAAX protease family)
LNAKRALLLFAAYFGAQLGMGIVIGIGVGVLYGVRRAPGGVEALRTAVLVGGAMGLVTAGLVVFWLTRRMLRGDPQGLRQIGWRKGTSRSLLLAAVAGLVLGLFYVVVVIPLFPLPPEFKGGPIAQAISDGGWKLYLWAVLALAIAPTVEEFVFRGALWTGFERSWGPIVAGLVVTLLFVVMHLLESGRYPPAIAAIATLGAGCIVARVASGSLLPPILMHLAYNGVIVIGTVREYGG